MLLLHHTYWYLVNHTDYILLRTSKVVVGKRKFDGGHQNPADIKRRYPGGLIGNGGSWGSLPLPQQPLGTNGEQWYTDTFSTWS